jgi:rSAM/selenodomain-associated transferase 1
MPLPSLLLFARAPEAGKVKTRLAARLTADGATELYRAFLEDAGRAYLAPARWESVLCAEPSPLDPGFASLFPDPWRGERQEGGDLGDRLRRAFEREFARGAPAVVAVGADHPALPRGRLAAAFEELAAGNRAVLVPAEDGGYCAIGLTAGIASGEVFRDVPWSTSSVLPTTLERLEGLGVRHRLLPAGYDVDRPEDVDRLRRELALRDPAEEDYPAATARALRIGVGDGPAGAARPAEGAE